MQKRLELRNLSTCICENSKYLKSTADTSVIKFDEIITVGDILSPKMTYSTIATNVTSTVSINCHSKKVRDCLFCMQIY